MHFVCFKKFHPLKQVIEKKNREIFNSIIYMTLKEREEKKS